jgi:hypothetical protein
VVLKDHTHCFQPSPPQPRVQRPRLTLSSRANFKQQRIEQRWKEQVEEQRLSRERSALFACSSAAPARCPLDARSVPLSTIDESEVYYSSSQQSPVASPSARTFQNRHETKLDETNEKHRLAVQQNQQAAECARQFGPTRTNKQQCPLDARCASVSSDDCTMYATTATTPDTHPPIADRG